MCELSCVDIMLSLWFRCWGVWCAVCGHCQVWCEHVVCAAVVGVLVRGKLRWVCGVVFVVVASCGYLEMCGEDSWVVMRVSWGGVKGPARAGSGQFGVAGRWGAVGRSNF